MRQEGVVMGKLTKMLQQVYTAWRYDSKLEGALRMAAKGRLTEQEFNDMLLSSEVYVLVQDVSANRKNIILVAELDGKRMIPVFSAVEKIKLFVKQKQRYTKIQGKEFFSLIKGTEPVVLNPGDSCSKTFSVEDVACLAK
jgi:hypothetical protein